MPCRGNKAWGSCAAHHDVLDKLVLPSQLTGELCHTPLLQSDVTGLQAGDSSAIICSMRACRVLFVVVRPMLGHSPASPSQCSNGHGKRCATRSSSSAARVLWNWSRVRS